MADTPAAPEIRRSRRWGRWTGIGLLGLLGLTAGTAALGWTFRVSLLNRFLTDATRVWNIRVESVDLEGGGLVIKGLQVTHADQTIPIFSAARIHSTADWRALKEGRLGAVMVDAPVVHWRAGLRSDPAKSTTAARGPMLTWDSVRITNGQIDLADPDAYAFTGSVSGQGGNGAWYQEGRLQQSSTTLSSDSPHYQINPGTGPVRSVGVKAATLALTGELDAATGILTLTQSTLAGTRVQLTGGPPPPPVTVPSHPDPDSVSSVIVSVRLQHLAAPALQVEASLPAVLTGRGDLALDRLTAGSGVPFSMEGARFSAASASLPAGAGLPDFSLTAGFNEGAARVENFVFSKALVPDLAGVLSQMGIPLPVPLTASFQAAGELRELDLSGPMPHSGSVQSLTLQDLKLALPGVGTGSFQKVDLSAVPDEVVASRRLRRVAVDGWQTELNLQHPLTPAPAPPEETAPAPPVAPAAAEVALRPLWEGWSADELKVSEGAVTATLPQAGGARITTALAIATTVAGNPDTPATWQVNLRNPQLSHPEVPGPPIALATAIQLTASVAGLWQKREIDSLTVAGTRLQIGDALFRLVSALPPAPPATPSPGPPATSAADPLPPQPTVPWKVRSLVLEDALIQIDNLGGRSRLDIPVKRQEFQNLPLDSTALAAVDRTYQIEVPNITLYNPYSTGQKVAVLDTNYIQFSPAGLLQRRLDRVDLMSPSLYAGQPLFDFVDAARKRFAEMAEVPATPAGDQPMLVDNTPDSPTVLSALASVTPSSSAAAAEWDIPFYTASGKVFVAPKGFPWPNLPVIPFRNARDARGKPVPFQLHGESFHGELAIEPGWYEFPEYKVRLRLSDRGRIIFNTPQKDHDNNLTEVFERNTLIFRQLQIDEAWLSITYDARGIYAKFGGLACGGTLTGAVNLYLDELYTWDAWASLAGIAMKPLTDKLTPDTFRMTGPVDELTVKAYGDTTTLYQAALDLKVTRPGLLHVLALDVMKDRIQALGGLRADLGKISMDTLRDFAYTGCTGGLKLFGTEGHGQLCLTGPRGSRTFNLRLHDYRARSPRTAAPF